MMSTKPPKNINSQDAALFRETVGGVRPVTTRRVSLRRAPPPPRAAFRRRDETQVLQDSLRLDPAELALETGEELSFRRPGVSTQAFTRLRRGRFVVKSEIDLHGLTAQQARQQLREFLAESLAEGLQCVRVVHGKGLRSGARGPVLKQSVNQWLRQWDAVLAFVSAPAHDGGTGAVYVLLRH